MIRDLFLWIRNWFYSDQIRISPSSGRLLELDAGSRFWLLDKVWTVIQIEMHSANGEADTIHRVYHLSDDPIVDDQQSEPCAQLVVTATRDGKSEPQGTLICGGSQRHVFSDDIVVMAKSSEPRCMNN